MEHLMQSAHDSVKVGRSYEVNTECTWCERFHSNVTQQLKA